MAMRIAGPGVSTSPRPRQLGRYCAGSSISALTTSLQRGTRTETVRSGLFEDHSAVFGLLTQIEALGLELVELHQVSS